MNKGIYCFFCSFLVISHSSNDNDLRRGTNLTSTFITLTLIKLVGWEIVSIKIIKRVEWSISRGYVSVRIKAFVDGSF
jgi:hypothetical protein